MGKAEQERLNLLFEMESIKSPLINYISPGVNLKVVAELGYKDKNGNKKRFYEETRYPSSKYKNIDHLISANFRINTYLVLEYPNSAYHENGNNYGILRNNTILIRAFAIEDLVTKMRLFTKNFVKCFKIVNGKITLLSDKMITVKAYPSMRSSISFTPDIFVNPMDNSEELGVRIILNDEYDFIISAETTWPELIYRIANCNLTLLGVQMVQSYMSLLPGMAISDMESNQYHGSRAFTPYWDNSDPEEMVNEPGSVGINSKPVTRKEKVKSFFSDI